MDESNAEWVNTLFDELAPLHILQVDVVHERFRGKALCLEYRRNQYLI